MSFFDQAISEVNEVTPKSGYNICLFDDFAPIGEKLTKVEHARTWAQAEAIAQSFEAYGAKVYIYGDHDEFDDLPINESVAVSSALNTTKIGAKPVVTELEGWLGKLAIPPEQYKPFVNPNIKELIQTNVPAMTRSRYAKYVYQGHEQDEICRTFHNKIYDLHDTRHRPVPPSEGLAYTNTHPNCRCYWDAQDDYEGKGEKLDESQLAYVQNIHRLIGQRARRGTLHTVKQDGTLSNRTRGTNPLNLIQETLGSLSAEFAWLSPEYMQKVRDMASHVGGTFLLIRAAGETITDHRSEGEPYMRKLIGDEIREFARTAINKKSDINHLTSLGTNTITDGMVIDAQYDQDRKELQILHYEQDPEIIEYVQRGWISEVSINAGMPRRMDIEPCEVGRCLVPRGLVLGELDDIAFTYVVTKPDGIVWRGRFIPKAIAGVKTTAIQVL